MLTRVLIPSLVARCREEYGCGCGSEKYFFRKKSVIKQ